ncbi:MAG TPA: carbohydrate kinase family protein [Candidatus Saccharimonadales bacterium]
MIEKDVAHIIAIGAAVQDVFLSGDVFKAQNEDGVMVEEFHLGEKYDVEDVVFATGGGAANAAVTFARQGLHSKFLGRIADDLAGKAVIEDLHKETVDTSLVIEDKDGRTGYSTLLLAPSGERTILTFRGSSSQFEPDDFKLKDIEADWLYISSLAGNLDALERAISEAVASDIKIAINPGKDELNQPERLKDLLKKCHILALNKDEIQKLVEGDSDEALVRHCSDMVSTVVMTDGPQGVTATNREQVIKGGMYEDVPVIDRTGAGDAFASGLVAMLAQNKSLSEAIIFASANSTSVVGKIGAKAGILSDDAILHEMPLEIKDF